MIDHKTRPHDGAGPIARAVGLPSEIGALIGRERRPCFRRQIETQTHEQTVCSRRCTAAASTLGRLSRLSVVGPRRAAAGGTTGRDSRPSCRPPRLSRPARRLGHGSRGSNTDSRGTVPRELQLPGGLPGLRARARARPARAPDRAQRPRSGLGSGRRGAMSARPSDKTAGLSDARRRRVAYKETAVSDTPPGVRISDYRARARGAPCGVYKRNNRGPNIHIRTAGATA